MADRKRLLPGEPPDSEYAEDANHWLTVYGDLVAFFDRYGLRAGADGPGAAAGSLATAELDPSQPEVLLGRLRERRDFWAARHRSLRDSD